MVKINSVLGPIDTDTLGYTLPHEHVLVSSAGIGFTYPEFIDRETTLNLGGEQLASAYEGGVRTIVDLSTLDLGRDVRLLQEVSQRSGVNVIVATGTWRDIPRVFWSASPDDVASLYVREILEGIEGTDIRAGIIKVANDQGGVTPEGEVILRAAARAQRCTGVPISTHTWAPERVGEQQVKIFEEEGVDLNRVYIGHSNDTADLDYLVGLLEKGVWLGLDRYPGPKEGVTPDWQARTALAKKLIDLGYGDRIMLSHDWAVTLGIVSVDMQQERKDNNPHGYLFIKRVVEPRLLDLGVSPEMITRITESNPRRFFEGSS